MMLSPPWILIVLICASLVHSIPRGESSSEAHHKIQSLPGQPYVTFQQFSGYIPIDDKQQRALFYYFVEAQSNSSSKPLVLWLNGGPGCSSIGFGAFTENGPFTTNYGVGDSIVKNKYSWNREANILYLESPAGVGFSYSTDPSFYGTLNDDITARDNLVFLKRWFAKYPEYKNRDFYIMGESYGGHYAPQLAELIVKSKADFNLKGLAVGNGLLEFETDYNARDEYLWSHGMLSDAAYKLRTSYCNNSRFFREYLSGNYSPNCLSVFIQAAILTHWRLTPLTLPQILGSSHLQKDEVISQDVDECIEKYAETYLNRKDVQSALHARLVGINKYRLCSPRVVNEYSRADQEIPSINAMETVVRSGVRVIVYSGDLDTAVPFTGSRRVVNAVAKKLRLETTVPYSAWFVGKQVGGWTQVYGETLTFATIRGASHSTPTTQPKRSFVLFRSFLHGKPLPQP